MPPVGFLPFACQVNQSTLRVWAALKIDTRMQTPHDRASSRNTLVSDRKQSSSSLGRLEAARQPAPSPVHFPDKLPPQPAAAFSSSLSNVLLLGTDSRGGIANRSKTPNRIVQAASLSIPPHCRYGIRSPGIGALLLQRCPLGRPLTPLVGQTISTRPITNLRRSRHLPPPPNPARPLAARENLEW